jgi:hypothetical protein
MARLGRTRRGGGARHAAAGRRARAASWQMLALGPFFFALALAKPQTAFAIAICTSGQCLQPAAAKRVLTRGTAFPGRGLRLRAASRPPDPSIRSYVRSSRGLSMQDKDSDQARPHPAAWRRPAWPTRLRRPTLFRRPTLLRRPVRPWHAVLAFGVFCAAFAAAVLAGLAWGRPHVMWHFRTADNRLTLGLAAGHGPFAGWLLSRSSVAASGHDGRQVMLSLHPGSTSRVTPTVISVWATASAPITVHVPPAPAITRRTITTASVAVHFSLPVTIDSAACRPRPPAAAMATVRFARGIRACAGNVEVSAASGERARLPLTVPALAPDPVTFFGPPDDRALLHHDRRRLVPQRTGPASDPRPSCAGHGLSHFFRRRRAPRLLAELPGRRRRH